ncbi:decaheme c-type cytochrome, OmcA/MtrC family [Ferrimonas balearica DSM 9799]|uniref:Decaheme c-type cytochrome, OmcA/MtrC family n=1 Tax=Ferrimonas balearica (strain DSM 9799 / CCM 4581 / KCTC 23876 / PAT) TaxID=550540 RepID=E1SMM2_FERBD|nr:OmcA/MtrC family decaheme c-type cytochrome [Ferrimonas balearica]ADN75561.1 decaheme c-type cytochrome, OmcA/MtrC family [Ferrimonas balearica DSM 9799]
MMTNNKMQWRLTACAAIMATALVGCGDDGNDGNDGDPGRPGGNPAETIAQLNLEVTKVEYVDGQPQVTVLATNEEDESVVGLQSMEVKNFQLYPQGFFQAGDSARWASAGSSKVYEDHGNGYYTFSFEGIEQNSDLTQRYNVLAGNNTLPDGTPVPRNEISEDFDGQGNDALYTKDVISHDACTACHVEGEPLTTRHSSYFEAETCINCHNEDRMTGKRASFQHLVHTIHNTAATFTDKNDREYTGQAAEALLQNNCQACHVASEELAEWGNWTRVPTKETCSACHNNGYDGKDVVHLRHLAEQDNSSCAACHNPTQIESIHMKSHQDEATVVEQFGMTATSVVNADNSVTISVNLTENGQPIDAGSVVNSLDMVEYVSNVGPKFPVLGYYSKDSKAFHGEEIAAAIEGGSVVYTTKALPFAEGDADTALTMVGVRVCAENGVLAECSDNADKIALDAYTSFVSKSGAALSERHNSLDNASCLGCHGETFQLHNGSHHAGFVLNDNIKVGDCAACHTPEGTYAPTNMGAIELKLHKVHGEQWIVADCAQCHTDFEVGSFNVKGALNTGAAEDGTALYSTPRAATCISCHNPADTLAGGETLQQHIVNVGGGLVDVPRDQADAGAQVETCFYCHKPELNNHTVVSF